MLRSQWERKNPLEVLPQLVLPVVFPALPTYHPLQCWTSRGGVFFRLELLTSPTSTLFRRYSGPCWSAPLVYYQSNSGELRPSCHPPLTRNIILKGVPMSHTEANSFQFTWGEPTHGVSGLYSTMYTFIKLLRWRGRV